MIVIERVGPAATVQDLGRPGWFHSGVGPSGAADRGALRLANRLVGNPEGYAGIEVLLGGLTLRAETSLLLAVTGAPAPATLDGTPVGHASVLHLAPGQRLRLGTTRIGLRSYIGVRGGIDVPPVLGSRSYDTLSGIGPPPLREGETVPTGPQPGDWPNIEQAPLLGPDATLEIHAVPGPRDDWFIDPAALFAGDWSVSADSDRIGARLDRADGPALRRKSSGELATEGMALGSVQVPPSGQPVIFLADHPITGGYPVIAVVTDADIDRVAQARPGQRLRFRRAAGTG
ncbi:biotin-dependent carboxyltransferase family protein [Nocardia grenadensis]|uniref:5-oxoprolinase subunit C family protein n=1 Tax=Nocardia grenadensis TaxID=931537 RepID=UPI0007A4E445|nr:biotin-dependent carboxyltransferase family protein [Nocardia grenadensis]